MMSGRFIDVWDEAWQRMLVPFLRDLEAERDTVLGDVIEECFRMPRRPTEPIPAPDIARDDDGNVSDIVFQEKMEAYRTNLERHETDLSAYIDAASGNSPAPWLKMSMSNFSSEKECVKFISSAAIFLLEEYPDVAAPSFLGHVRSFIARFGLGYSLTASGSIILNQLGIFANILRSNYEMAAADAYLVDRMNDLEEALNDLARTNPQSPGRMKTLLSKAMALLEAYGVRNPDLKGQTISGMVKNLDLPHPTLSKLIETLYGFRGDFPGIAHGGNPDGMSRELEIKDMLVLTVLITALTPYFLQNFDSQKCYENDFEAA